MGVLMSWATKAMNSRLRCWSCFSAVTSWKIMAAPSFAPESERTGAPRTSAGELTKDARERYQIHVKAIFQVGSAHTHAYATVFGYPAEIVPLTNPYAVRVRDTLTFRALVDGRPAVDQLVIAGGEQDGKARDDVRARSDSTGVARFAISAPGKWYIKFIHMVPVTGDSVNYESKWATLTFQVR